MADGAPPKTDPDDLLDSLAETFHARDRGAAAGGLGVSLDEPSHEELRSGALARRLAQRRGYAIRAREPRSWRLLSSWGLAGVMLLSLWSLWGAGPELRYWLSSAPPVNLGHLGGYHLEDAREGEFARVEGIASARRASYTRLFSEHELIPLVASRILVDRARPPDESMRGFGFSYSGEGRLVRASEGSKWDGVRAQFVDAGELARAGDVWVLEEGVVPRKGLRVPGEVSFWALLALACAVALAARARKQLAAAQAN